MIFLCYAKNMSGKRWDDIMRLELRNVGKVRFADIVLEGITVIAGENNTGKSTVGKMLYCIFHTFYKIEEQIKKEKIKSVSRVLRSFYQVNFKRIVYMIKIRRFATRLVEQQDKFLLDVKLIEKEIESYFINEERDFAQYIEQDGLEKLAKKIYDLLTLENSEIQKMILQKRLEAEFAMKVVHLNYMEQKASIKLSSKNGCIDFQVIKNEEIQIVDYINLNEEIIYIDNPFVLDSLEVRHSGLVNELGHQQDLLQKLENVRKEEDFSLVDELLVKKKLEKILEKISDVCDGELVSEDRNAFLYKTDSLNGELDMVNLSTGIKSFVMLRQLLLNGIIDENGMIILDEPEIHLHPEWQLKFAEIIVLLQKEFGVNILLNTHSPYFLNAIEVYAGKYEIEKKCNYYLANEENGIASIMDVTEKTEKIYEKLARPLQLLENMEYGNTEV